MFTMHAMYRVAKFVTLAAAAIVVVWVLEEEQDAAAKREFPVIEL